MSSSLVAAVGCALLAGAFLPRTPDRGLDRIRAAVTTTTTSGSGPGGALPHPQLSSGVAGVAMRRRWLASGRSWFFRSRTAEQTRISLIELADALSVELRAGASPRQALWRATRDAPRFAAVAAAARSPAGDVASALNDVAGGCGGAAAADLATAWSVCESAGGRLAAPVARLAGSWRDEEQVRREVKAQLAGPRATACLLAGLPVVGLAMGVALGADPLALLARPSMALVVVLPGLLLEIVGLLWTARITRRAASS